MDTSPLSCSALAHIAVLMVLAIIWAILPLLGPVLVPFVLALMPFVFLLFLPVGILFMYVLDVCAFSCVS